MSHRDAPPPPKPPPWRPHRRRRRSAPSDTPCSVHRDLLLLSTATSPAQFVAEDYLAAACGLTPAQAAKASRRLRHLDSASNPDAVRAFLGGVGLSDADVAAAIVRDPRILCSRVDKTLAPKVARLRGIGLSPPQISRLVVLEPRILACPKQISRLPFYLSFLGSFEQAIIVLRRNPYLLGVDVENVVKPNMAFLQQQCRLSASDIAKLLMLPSSGNLMSMKPEHLKQLVARVEKLGVRRNSGMFKRALTTVCCQAPERIEAKMEFLKAALGCSEAEQAVRKMPTILECSEHKLGRTVEFLRVEVGLEPGYIAQRPVMLLYDLERRLMPRHCVIKVLKAKRLVKEEIDFFRAVCLSNKNFLDRFVHRYDECPRGLADDYAAGCEM